MKENKKEGNAEGSNEKTDELHILPFKINDNSFHNIPYFITFHISDNRT
jgi:hypothetical protein